MSNRLFLGIGLTALLVLVSCTSGPTKGTITIVTQIDFTTEPFPGTFEVTEGAEVLGCEGGSLVGTLTASAALSELTCESGQRSGTFTVEYDPQDIPGPGDLNSPWSVKEATDDFSGLSGGGDFWVILDEQGESGVETLTGEIQYSR